LGYGDCWQARSVEAAPPTRRLEEPPLLNLEEPVTTAQFTTPVAESETDGGLLRLQEANLERLPPVDQVAPSGRLFERLPPTRSFERLPRVSQRMTRLPAVAASFERLPAVRKDPALVSKDALADATARTHELPLVAAPLPAAVAEISETTQPGLDPKAPASPTLADLWTSDDETWVAVAQRSDLMVEHGFALAEKGALYSARAEFKQALRSISQALDAHLGGKQYSTALAAGWQALEEADDFSKHSQREPVVNVAVIVDQHQTPVLQGSELDDVSPVVAMQSYFTYAQEQLVASSGGAPVASRALYGLGKLHMLLGEQSASAERLHGPKAIALHQAALLVDSRNHLAANELGVLLARFGQHQEAREALQQSVAVHPLPESWHNLSVVHQRLGNAELAAQAAAHGQWLQSNTPPHVLEQRPVVQWVAPQQFAGSTSVSMPANAVAHPATATNSTRQAQATRRFLWW